MNEITFTAQRPRTTSAEIPESLKPLKPLKADPEIAKLIAEWKRRGEERFGAEGKEQP